MHTKHLSGKTRSNINTIDEVEKVNVSWLAMFDDILVIAVKILLSLECCKPVDVTLYRLDFRYLRSANKAIFNEVIFKEPESFLYLIAIRDDNGSFFANKCFLESKRVRFYGAYNRIVAMCSFHRVAHGVKYHA